MFGYLLDLNSARTTPEVKTELLSLLGLRHLSEVSVRWPAMTISVRDREGLHALSLEICVEELGVPLTTRVYYSVDNKIGDNEFGRAKDAMFASAAQLVNWADAVAVFSFESGSVIMRCLDGVLYLSEEWKTWRNPDVASQVPGEPVFRAELDSMTPPPAA
ncbi:MAG: hypothetical protein LBK42_07115 [Propionibacteriaceae bacterium]|jgi:hypothetical protein|nr:hypothetical protein [Propionibacteriaceae bacterium]